MQDVGWAKTVEESGLKKDTGKGSNVSIGILF